MPEIMAGSVRTSFLQER